MYSKCIQNCNAQIKKQYSCPNKKKNYYYFKHHTCASLRGKCKIKLVRLFVSHTKINDIRK